MNVPTFINVPTLRYQTSKTVDLMLQFSVHVVTLSPSPLLLQPKARVITI